MTPTPKILPPTLNAIMVVEPIFGDLDDGEREGDGVFDGEWEEGDTSGEGAGDSSSGVGARMGEGTSEEGDGT